jgi:hypothetical protein
MPTTDPEILEACKREIAQITLTATIFLEARGELASTPKAVNGVGETIRNRVLDTKNRWPKDYTAVCLQKLQFSCWNTPADFRKPPDMRYLFAKDMMQKFISEPTAWHDCQYIAMLILRNGVSDWVMGANHYHDVSITPPYKAWGFATPEGLTRKKVAQYGRLIFYKL